MSRGALGVVLGAALAVMAVRVADRLPAWTLECRAHPVVHCSPSLRQRLQALDRPLFVTYWASEATDLPSSLRHLPGEVRQMLRACRDAAPGRFDFQVLEPAADPMAQRSAARRGAGPFRIDRIVEDAPSQSTMWSSLGLELGEEAAQTVHTVLPQHLPRLQELLCAWLDEVHAPTPRRVAISAPPDRTRLREALSAHARVEELDLRRAGPGLGVDTLWCLDPPAVGAERRREIEDFLARGGSVVLAGPSPRIEAVRGAAGDPAGEAVARLESTAAFEDLLAEWGLGLSTDCVLDRAALEGPAPEEAAPEDALPTFLLESVAPDQDFRSLGDLISGSFLFRAPSALSVDDGALRRRGLEAEVLATSADHGRRVPWDATPRPVETLRSLGRAAPKQPLMMHVHSVDRWRGSLVVLTSDTPFLDEMLDRPGTVHHAWLDALMDHLGSAERRARARTPRAEADPLPVLGTGARWSWRLAVVAGLPAVWLLGLAIHGRRLVAARRPRRGAARAGLRTAALLAAPLLLPAVVATLRPDLALRRDETQRLAPATRQRLDELRASGGVRCTWLRSPAAELPPELRPRLDELRALLRRLASHGKFELVERDAGLAGAEELADWTARGARRVDRASPGREDRQRDRDRFWCSLRLERKAPRAGDPAPMLSFASESDFEAAEFRLALGLHALQLGRRVSVAFASDSPRPSPAEGYEHYQQQGRIPPRGSDVYSQARQCLAEAGFEVVHVNPRDPVLPEDFDALVWMQPRRDVRPMLQRTVEALHRGARVMIASQHFVMQAHQYRGRGYEVVYWPEPQTPDLDRFYFPRLGIRLVREILLDRNLHDQTLVSRVHGREARREFEAQTSALPFHVRAETAGMDPDSALTRRLGPQSFSGAAFLEWDEDRLARLGLRAHSLIRSSPLSWSLTWSGGYLEPERFAPPSDPTTLGPRHLAVLFEGRFPAPDSPWAPEAPPPSSALPPAPPDTPEGRLLWTTGSTAFRDGLLRREGLRADRLLLQGVATLALPPDLAELAGRRREAPTLGWVSAGERARWRALVLGLPLPVLLLAVLLWRLARRRGGA